MTIFDVIRNLFFKSKLKEDLNIDTLNVFQPYMINRWLSFYGKKQAVFTNDTLNKYSNLFEDKLAAYKFYEQFIPKCSYKQISYVKKKKADKESLDSEFIPLIANSLNISQREVKQSMDLYKQLRK
jgi:hypothetical protein